MPGTVADEQPVPGQPCAAKPSEPTVVMTISSMIRGLSSSQ